MKRTTERADLAEKQVPEYISGCRQFEGEDLSKLMNGFSFTFHCNNYRLPIQSSDQCLPPEGVDQGAEERAPVGRRKPQGRRVSLCCSDRCHYQSQRHDGGRHDHEETTATIRNERVQSNACPTKEGQRGQVEARPRRDELKRNL